MQWIIVPSIIVPDAFYQLAWTVLIWLITDFSCWQIHKIKHYLDFMNGFISVKNIITNWISLNTVIHANKTHFLWANVSVAGQHFSYMKLKDGNKDVIVSKSDVLRGYMTSQVRLDPQHMRKIFYIFMKSKTLNLVKVWHSYLAKRKANYIYRFNFTMQLKKMHRNSKSCQEKGYNKISY